MQRSKTVAGMCGFALIGAAGVAGSASGHRDIRAEPQSSAPVSAQNLVRRFNCEIGRVGADPCGKASYGVLAGKYVRIALEGSGGKSIEFKIYSTRTGRRLGSRTLNAGDRRTIWTNYSRRRVNVRFTADADGVVNTIAEGKFLFGPY